MNLKETVLISSIQTLFRHDEGLIYFFFNHKKPEIRCAAEELLADARGMSHGEYLLIQAAIDMWNGQGGFSLSRALDVWDDENIMAFVAAIISLRGLPADVILDLTSC